MKDDTLAFHYSFIVLSLWERHIHPINLTVEEESVIDHEQYLNNQFTTRNIPVYGDGIW